MRADRPRTPTDQDPAFETVHARGKSGCVRRLALHAAAAVPLMLEMIVDPQGSFADQALATLGFVGSDNPEHIAVLIPALKRSPDFVLRGLLQFEALPQSVLNAILDYVEASPGRALKAENCERIVGCVRHSGALHAETLLRIDRLRKDKTRPLALRCGGKVSVAP